MLHARARVCLQRAQLLAQVLLDRDLERAQKKPATPRTCLGLGLGLGLGLAQKEPATPRTCARAPARGPAGPATQVCVEGRHVWVDLRDEGEGHGCAHAVHMHCTCMCMCMSCTCCAHAVHMLHATCTCCAHALHMLCACATMAKDMLKAVRIWWREISGRCRSPRSLATRPLLHSPATQPHDTPSRHPLTAPFHTPYDPLLSFTWWMGMSLSKEPSRSSTLDSDPLRSGCARARVGVEGGGWGVSGGR